MLSCAGYNPGTVDAYFGTNSTAAMANYDTDYGFQRNGLINGTGTSSNWTSMKDELLIPRPIRTGVFWRIVGCGTTDYFYRESTYNDWSVRVGGPGITMTFMDLDF